MSLPAIFVLPALGIEWHLLLSERFWGSLWVLRRAIERHFLLFPSVLRQFWAFRRRAIEWHFLLFPLFRPVFGVRSMWPPDRVTVDARRAVGASLSPPNVTRLRRRCRNLKT